MLKKNGMIITIAVIDNEVSIRKTSEKYNIPRSTLHEWLYRSTTHKKRGSEETLSAME
jgi:hypothetical protein